MSSKEGDLGDCRQHAEGSGQPHDGHDGNQTHEQLLNAFDVVLGRQLVSHDDKLQANHDSGQALSKVSVEQIVTFGAL